MFLELSKMLESEVRFAENSSKNFGVLCVHKETNSAQKCQLSILHQSQAGKFKPSLLLASQILTRFLTILGVKQALGETLFKTWNAPKKKGLSEKRKSGVQLTCIPGELATSCYEKQHKLLQCGPVDPGQRCTKLE